MRHSWLGRSPGKSLDLLERQETFVSGCVRRGESFPVCPQKTEHCLSELQRRVRAVAISSDPRDRHELLTLLLLPPRILCASAGHYPHPTGSLCNTPLPGSCDTGTCSLGKHTACLRLLQCHTSLCHLRLSPYSNSDYRSPPSPWPE